MLDNMKALDSINGIRLIQYGGKVRRGLPQDHPGHMELDHTNNAIYVRLKDASQPDACSMSDIITLLKIMFEKEYEKNPLPQHKKIITSFDSIIHNLSTIK